MLEIKVTNQFKKDIKLAKKRNNDLNLLKEVIDLLAKGEKLPLKYRDHSLKGNYVNYRECHIQPDFLLIYHLTNIELQLIRVGTRSDLFR